MVCQTGTNIKIIIVAYCKAIAIGDVMDVCTYTVLFYCACYCLVKPSENCLIVCICDYDLQ